MAGAAGDGRGAPGAHARHHLGSGGVGKDTIIDALRQRPHDPDYHYVVTCTTRAPRPGEIDGVSYHFLDRGAVPALRDAGELLEANEVHGNWYGTPRDAGPRALAEGQDVILKIDVQGAQQVKERVDEALLIFIVPPSMETLFERLRARATETADELELRQRNAAIELARQEDYDYVVTNETGQVERTAARIDEIIEPSTPGPPDAAGPTSTRRVGVTLRSTPAWTRRPLGPRSARRALVEVAVDAAGARRRGPTRTSCRRRSPTSSAARRCSSSSAGARRSGSSSARRRRRPGSTPKPIVDRVRADGPLLPPLGARAGRAGSPTHYLAPPALVLRAMLPPGLLERLELVAELAPVGAARHAAGRATPRPRPARPARARPAAGPRPGRPEGRAGLAAAAPRARRRGPGHARLDAPRRRRRAALRALDPR